MKKVFLVFTLVFSALVSSSLSGEQGCGSSCDPTSDPKIECGDECSYCKNTDLGSTGYQCFSCCELGDGGCQSNANSPSFCDWNTDGNFCENIDNAACIPEVPKQSKSWLIIGFGLLAMLLSGGALGYKKVRSTKRPS